MHWIPIDRDNLPSEGRFLLYTPKKSKRDHRTLQYRVVDGDFIKSCVDATHYIPLEPPKSK